MDISAIDVSAMEKNNILFFFASADEILPLTHPSRLDQLFQANTIETI